jgi:TorA maturation chaperone TorD
MVDSEYHECTCMSRRGDEQEVALWLARRTYLYRLLHVVFGAKPTADTLGQVASDMTVESMAYVQGLLSFPVAADVAQTRIGADGPVAADCVDAAIAQVKAAAKKASEQAFVEELQTEFDKLYQVPGPDYVHPWESPYTGPAETTFQPSTLDVRSYYHRAGFKLQAEKHFPDDHIGAMMDFLGNLSQQAYDAYADGKDKDAAATLETQDKFVHEHVLTWVDVFATKTADHDEQGFYTAFARFAAAFVRFDVAILAQIQPELA